MKYEEVKAGGQFENEATSRKTTGVYIVNRVQGPIFLFSYEEKNNLQMLFEKEKNDSVKIWIV